MDFMPLVNTIVPGRLADLLVAACEATGLKWGVMSRTDYFFQSPKLHIALFVLAMIFCSLLWQQSRNYRKLAITNLTTRGVGWSLKCPLNTAAAGVLMLCFAMQVFAKGSRPKPLIQLGWLLMPCHMTTLAWIYLLLRQKRTQYGKSCYIATLLMDWLWNPVGALASPDWDDHQFAFEGHVFLVHHWLLVLLPLYFAARYHTEALSKEHILHLTLIPTFVNFAIKTPIAMFLGLNVDYMLLPPTVKALPPVFHSIYYRVPYVGLFVVMSCACNLFARFIGKCIAVVFSCGEQLKRKAS